MNDILILHFTYFNVGSFRDASVNVDLINSLLTGHVDAPVCQGVIEYLLLFGIQRFQIATPFLVLALPCHQVIFPIATYRLNIHNWGCLSANIDVHSTTLHTIGYVQGKFAGSLISHVSNKSKASLFGCSSFIINMLWCRWMDSRRSYEAGLPSIVSKIIACYRTHVLSRVSITMKYTIAGIAANNSERPELSCIVNS